MTGRRRLLIGVGAVAVAALVVLVVSRRNAQAAGGDQLDSGYPSGNANESRAQRPTGGAGNVPGNLPDFLVTQPDTLQQQVQQTDAASVESPQSLYTPTPYGPGQQLAPGTYVAPGVGPYAGPGGVATANPEWNSYISGGTENVWNVGGQPNLSASGAAQASTQTPYTVLPGANAIIAFK